jgi:hypothetical protein
MQKVVKALQGAENKILYHVEVHGHSINVARVTMMINMEKKSIMSCICGECDEINMILSFC